MSRTVCVNLVILPVQLVWDQQDTVLHAHRHNFYTTAHVMITVHDMTPKANVWHHAHLDFISHQILHVCNVHKVVPNAPVQVNVQYVRAVHIHILVIV